MPGRAGPIDPYCVRIVDGSARSFLAAEVGCTAHGDDRCEFIMAPFDKLDALSAKLKDQR